MDPAEYSYVVKEIRRLTKVDLDCYKAPQMQRRLRILLLRSGHTTFKDFFEHVQGDRAELEKLRDYLTINVSSFFRDTQKYEQLRQTILPELLGHSPSLHIWSAGCSRGQEPYSLAISLIEMTGATARHRITATDIDGSALEIARNGGPYPSSEVTGVVGSRSRYIEERDDGIYVKPDLRRRITFKHQNLLSDPFERNLDLIVCRNVIIYFSVEVKNKLFHRFHDALRPGGILFLGATELVPKSSDFGFESAGISFYRRAD